MSDWQPIETAPRDGTPILLISKGYIDDSIPNKPIHHQPKVAVGTWNPDGDSWTDEFGNMDGDDICQLTVTGTWSSGGGWFQPNEVTHWMPLPDPPKEPTP